MRRSAFAALLGTVLLLGFAMLAGGCRPRETAVERGVREQVLHRGFSPDIADLDPHVAMMVSDYGVISAFFEGLVAEDPRDLHPVPGVAERWTVSADGLTYTFHLRSNARWSNGDPITAPDFLASWRRALTPSFGCDNANLMYVVRGAADFHQGRATRFSDVGFAAPDARTVVITLERPTPYFLSLLQHWVWWPVHFPTLEKAGDPYARGTRWTRPETFVGNGPFRLREWTIGQRIVGERSETYWDAASVRLRELRLYPMEDINAEERAFRGGQLHVTEAVPAAKIDAYRASPSGELRMDPALGTYFYRLNVTHPSLASAELRRALAQAVDREAIVTRILRGTQVASAAFTPGGLAGYEPPRGLEYDPDAARASLAAAGYPGGKGAPELELLFNSSENHRAIAEALQEMWRRELGLSVRLVSMEGKTVLDARRTGQFQLLRSSGVGDYADPMTFLAVWRGASGNNYTGWRSPAYEALLDQAERTPSEAERATRLREAETLLLSEAPLIPLYRYTHVYLLHPQVRGWYSNPMGRHPYKHVWLEPTR
jgi:oligopeptide transport system substrate-binding protein